LERRFKSEVHINVEHFGEQKKAPDFLRGQLLLRDLVADLLTLKDHAAILGHCPLQHKVTRINGRISAVTLFGVVCRARESGSGYHKHGRGYRGGKEFLHNSPPFIVALIEATHDRPSGLPCYKIFKPLRFKQFLRQRRWLGPRRRFTDSSKRHPTFTVVRRSERATFNFSFLTLEQSYKSLVFAAKTVLWECVLWECVPMDANDCREYSNRCIEMANEAVTNASQTKLLWWAEVWLNLAEEIDNDAIMRNQVRAVIAMERTRCARNRPRHPSRCGERFGIAAPPCSFWGLPRSFPDSRNYPPR
jgi:hypothetical protein